MTGVTLSGLHKKFGASPSSERGAVDGIDLHVAPGEFFVLLGPSGCGKTTTLRCIAGLETPTSGAIHIGVRPVFDAAAGISVATDRRALGMMFQSYALWPHKTVAENVAYPLLQKRGASRAAVLEKVRAKLALVGLDNLEHRYPGELSGGQQQRVALARAIVAEPRLLLFDEPLSNLDAQLRTRLRADLRRVHDETGATSIYVTHDQSEAFALADRVAVLRAGRIEQIGTPQEIFRAPATRFVAEFVGYENVLAAARVTGNRVSVDGLTLHLKRQVAAGASGTLAFRAGALPLSHGGEGALAGRVESVAFLGEHYQLRLRVEDLLLTGTMPLSDARRPEIGDVVSGTIDPSNLVFIAEGRDVPVEVPALAA